MSHVAPSRWFTVAIGQRFANRHLLSGEVTADGLDLEYPVVERVQGTGAPMPMFSTLARDHPWDIGEQALSTYLMARGAGKPWIAIPIFPSRFFPHTGAWVSRQAEDVRSPDDLVGRRIACGSFGTNYAVWWRGALTHQYDVPIQKMIWVESVDEHVPGFRPPRRFETERIPGHTEPVAVVGAGLTDAAALPGPARDADRERIRPLFEDPYEAIRAFVEQFGFIPVNTVLTVRQDAVERNPDMPRAVFDAFVKARALYDKEIEEGGQDAHMGLSLRQLRQRTGLTLPPDGLAANRSCIQAMLAFCYEQGITPNLLRPEEAFLLPES